MIGRDERCTGEEAAHLAGNLVGFYPAREVVNAQAYIEGLTALLACYPMDFVRRVCNPAYGLPSRCKWLPTLAEVCEALDAESRRRTIIGANALYVIREAEKKREQAEADAKWQAENGDMEERRKRVAALVSTFKARSLSPAHTAKEQTVG